MTCRCTGTVTAPGGNPTVWEMGFLCNGSEACAERTQHYGPLKRHRIEGCSTQVERMQRTGNEEASKEKHRMNRTTRTYSA